MNEIKDNTWVMNIDATKLITVMIINNGQTMAATGVVTQYSWMRKPKEGNVIYTDITLRLKDILQ